MWRLWRTWRVARSMVTVTFELGNVRVQAEETQARANSGLLEGYWQKAKGEEGEFKEIKVILPTWVALKALQTYQSYLLTHKVHQEDVNSTLNCLDLAVLLEDQRLEATLLHSDCFLSLARNHSVAILATAARFKHRSEAWKELYCRAFGLASEHLPYLLEKWKAKLAELPVKVARRLYRKALLELFRQGNGYDEGVVKALREVWQCKSGVELLLLEEQRCLKRPVETNSQGSVQFVVGTTEATAPVQAEELEIEAKWRLVGEKPDLQYSFQQTNGVQTLRLTLSLSFLSPTHPSPTTHIIDLFQGLSPVYSLPLPCPPPCSISLSLRPEPVLSSLTHYLGSTFDSPTASERLGSLSEEQLTAVLRSGVKVATEDSVLYVVGKWAEGRREGPAGVLEWVIWPEITLNCLLDCARRFRKLRENCSFREMFTKELLQRSGVCPASTSPSPSQRQYRSSAAKRPLSLQAFLSDVASAVPELDYTPRHLPEHDPAQNRHLSLLNEKQIHLERLKTHYRLLQCFNPPSDSSISIVPSLPAPFSM